MLKKQRFPGSLGKPVNDDGVFIARIKNEYKACRGGCIGFEKYSLEKRRA
jgi:hypothetical protein